ncbi:MAG: efflux RND transporter periplasmic adaptor subunit [Pontiella sp.]
MLKKIGIFIGFIAAISLGFFIRGLMPAGESPAGMMGFGDMPPPAVKAILLKEMPLDMLDEYIAVVEPVQQVMVRSEVSGYLDAVHFTEGAFVEAGDLLFSIDQNQYEALVEVREAELSRFQAEVNRSVKFLERMHEASERSVSQADLDTAESDHLQAVADLKQAEANLNLAKIDLAYAEIRAPISGRIGAAMLTKGNYVNSAADILAHLVQTDPIRVVFSMTDRAYLNLRRKILDGEADGMVAHVKLPNGVILPVVGKKDFDDNTMNSKTGTLAVRYLFNNPNELLVAGGYATIMLGQPERLVGIRIPQRAVLIDLQGSYVLTVNEEGQVGTARVELGSTIETDIVAVAGLSVGDRIVVEGLQKVQPGMMATVMMQEVLP